MKVNRCGTGFYARHLRLVMLSVLGVVLACSLYPLPAFASQSDLTTGSVETRADEAGANLESRALKAQAATLSLAKAKEAYAPAVKRLVAKNYNVYYKYADIVGDSTVELIAYAFPNESNWSYTVIYTLKSGKPKCILNRYGHSYLSAIAAYKAGGGLVLRGSGYGGDAYFCLKYSGGKYKEIAMKSRDWSTNAWSYSVPNGSGKKAISKSTFHKITKSLLVGKKVRVVKYLNGMAQVKNEANRYNF